MGSRFCISTAVRWSRCGCGLFVGIGYAEGWPTRVGAGKVDPVGELNGLVKGIASYDLIVHYGRHELVYRDVDRIRSREFPVFLAHDCGQWFSVEDPGDNWKKKRPADEFIVSAPGPVNSGGNYPPPPF